MNLEISPKPPSPLGLFSDYSINGNTIYCSESASISITRTAADQHNNATHNSLESFSKRDANKLMPIFAITLQLLVLALLGSLTSYARADTSSYPTVRDASYLAFDSTAGVTEDSYVHYENNQASNNPPGWLQLASLIEDEKRPVLYLQSPQQKSSWALAFDNDILAPGHRDRDYTYGLNFTYSGAGARDANISLKTPLAAIDGLVGLDHLPSVRDNYTIETGLFGFTPQVITEKNANPNDRPYASLVYFSSSHDQIDVEHNLAWKTTLTIGALGLGLVGELQNLAHKELSGKQANGWNNQISDGGELTGRYVVARQQYLEGFSDSLEVKSTLQGSIGYLTEASWSLSFRTGKILSPWSSFNPELISYGEKSTYTSNTKPTNEHYFWAGFTVKARAYNAFLEGQFRDSAVTYNHNDLNPIVVEGWIGYTDAIKEGYRFSYVLRGQSSEIQHGDGNRNVLWGGLILAKTI